MDKLILFIPLFIFLVYLDWLIAKRKKANNIFTLNNTILNIIIGAMQQVGTVFSFALLLVSLNYAYDKYHVLQINATWYNWIITYIALDFVSYWVHRFAHRVNIMWAAHITHHSSNFFNLSNSFRTSPFQDLNRIPFWLILAIIGFQPYMLFGCFIVSSLIDFFSHSQNFPKVKWLEYIFVTPSLHKVHHGKNAIYIDKNYGSTFIIWDRIFGTFQDETIQVQFGIKSNDYEDKNPVFAITYYYKYLVNIFKALPSIKHKIMLWFMPPDWPIALNIDTTVRVQKNKLRIKSNNTEKRFGYIIITFSLCCLFFVLLFNKLITVKIFLCYSVLLISYLITGYKLVIRNLNKHFFWAPVTQIIGLCILWSVEFFNLQNKLLLLGITCVMILFLFFTLQLLNKKIANELYEQQALEEN